MQLFITLSNAAFEGDNKNYEVARILDVAGSKFASGELREFVLRDVNGNTVGSASANNGLVLPREDWFSLHMSTDNAAFEDMGVGEEVARILHDLAEKIREDGNFERSLYDLNGNKVGASLESVQPVAIATMTSSSSGLRNDDAPSP